MKSAINYTGRKNIPLSNIDYTFDEKNSLLIVKEVSLKGIINYSDPVRVYAEAYRRISESKKIELTLSHDMITERTELQIPSGWNSFRLRIFATGEDKKIIAQASGLSIHYGIKSSGILNVQYSDIGDRIWHVDYDDDRGPILIINKNIPNIEIISREESFRAVVAPAMFKDIINRMVFVDGIDYDSPEVEWHEKWINFIENISGQIPDYVRKEEINDSDNKEEAASWIDEVVSEFCKKNNLLEKYTGGFDENKGND